MLLALNRLVLAATDSPDSATSYAFDAVGNRLGTAGTALAPDTGVPALPVVARPTGAATSYNAANQLTRVEEGGATTTLDTMPTATACARRGSRPTG